MEFYVKEGDGLAKVQVRFSPILRRAGAIFPRTYLINCGMQL